MTLRIGWIAVAAVVAAAPACDSGNDPAGTSSPSRPSATKTPKPKRALDELLAFGNHRRVETDFATLRPASEVMGADPYDLARVPGTELTLGLLRGEDAIVVLDRAAQQVQRLAAPAAPTGLAVTDNAAFVSGMQSSSIVRYELSPSKKLVRAEVIEVPGVLAIRDIAIGPHGVLYILDAYDGRLIALDPQSKELHRFGQCHRPVHVLREDRFVLVDCLLDHEVRVYDATAAGIPTSSPVAVIRHVGPIWSMDAAVADESMFIALGGVEDHPLFRDGAFGFIDAFVFAYEIDLEAFVTERLFAENVAQHGAVTPKWVALSTTGDAALAIDTAGYGGPNRVHIETAGRGFDPVITTAPLPPGTTDMVQFSDGGFVAANPLLDAWVAGKGGHMDIRTVGGQDSGPPRSVDVRVGEALFFTGLMAPWNVSEGRRSRFTCETCHFEGYVDGRTHYTTRGEVFSATKPLRGLFNNRPHFSRALDRTMSEMVHNEFRVANAKSGHSPWFSIDVADYSWLEHFGDLPQTLSAKDLRRSLMAFLMVFTHDPNPAVRGREGYSDLERRGAEAFRARCESCHQARLITADIASRVAFDRWESLIFSPSGPIVWASAEYKKTGVEPYVHPEGARVFSLRRVYRKWPYFTNGSATTLRGLLEKVRYFGERFFHDNAPSDDAKLVGLSDEEIDALLAFLRLL